MRKTAALVALVASLALATPAGAAKKPPKSDSGAQAACMTGRTFEVNDEFDFPFSQSLYTRLIDSLAQSKAKDAKATFKRAERASTLAAQEAAVLAVNRWCHEKLWLVCSGLQCVVRKPA